MIYQSLGVARGERSPIFPSRMSSHEIAMIIREEINTEFIYWVELREGILRGKWTCVMSLKIDRYNPFDL